MSGCFSGKVAVVTGGAHGIGRAIVDAFIREGAKVHVVDIQPGDGSVDIQPVVSIQSGDSSVDIQPVVSIQPGNGSVDIQPVDRSVDIRSGDRSVDIQPGNRSVDIQPGNGSVDIQPGVSIQPGNGSVNIQPGDRFVDIQPGDGFANIQSVVSIQSGDGFANIQPGDRSVDIQPGDGFADIQPGDRSVDIQPGDRSVDIQPGDGSVDIQPGDWFVGDISDPKVLERFAASVVAESGRVDCLINNAPPLMKGIDECGYDDFARALAVGVTAPFYLTKLLAPYFAPGASVVNISSSRDRMSQPQTESYTAAKGGIAALTHALAVSLAGKARVNSISPGWIDTTGGDIGGADAAQQPVGRVGRPEDIAELTLFLCSDKAGFITGENICVDGGMTRLMIYHGEHGWTYQ